MKYPGRQKGRKIGIEGDHKTGNIPDETEFVRILEQPVMIRRDGPRHC